MVDKEEEEVEEEWLKLIDKYPQFDSDTYRFVFRQGFYSGAIYAREESVKILNDVRKKFMKE